MNQNGEVDSIVEETPVVEAQPEEVKDEAETPAEGDTEKK